MATHFLYKRIKPQVDELFHNKRIVCEFYLLKEMKGADVVTQRERKVPVLVLVRLCSREIVGNLP